MYFEDKNHKEAFYNSNILQFYFSDLKVGVFDIETTGLSPDRNEIILGGLLTPENDGIRMKQIFSESSNEEHELLQNYISQLNNLDVIISYNGDNFDLPFINKRLHNNRQCIDFLNLQQHCLPMYQSFDLYRIIHRYSIFRKILPNLKQKTVETYMGLWSERADEISGAESVELYRSYTRTGDSALRDIIMLHNSDDILQLSRLMKVLEKLDLHNIMFHIGFMVAQNEKKLYVKKINLQRDFICFSGVHKNIPMDYRCYRTSHEANISLSSGEFVFKIPYKTIKGYDYIDLGDFTEDFSALSKYPDAETGCLIIKDQTNIYPDKINHFIKLISKESLKEL